MTAVSNNWMHPSYSTAAGASHMQWAASAMHHQHQQCNTQSFDIELECGMRNEVTDTLHELQQEATGEGFPRRRSASFDSLEQLQQQAMMDMQPSITLLPPHYPPAAAAVASSKPRGRASIDIAALAIRAQKTMGDAAAAAAALSAAVNRRQSLDPAAAARARAAARGRYSIDVAASAAYSAGTAAAPNANWANSSLFAPAAVPVTRVSSNNMAAEVLQHQVSADHGAHMHTGPMYTRSTTAAAAAGMSDYAAAGFHTGHTPVMHPSMEVFNNSSSNIGRARTGRRNMQAYPDPRQQQQRVRRSSFERPSLDLQRAAQDQHSAAAAAAAAAAVATAAAAQQSLLYQRTGSGSSASCISTPQQQLLQQRYAAMNAAANRAVRPSLDLQGRQSLDVQSRHSLDIHGRPSLDLQRASSGQSYGKFPDGRKGDLALQSLLYRRTGSGSSSCSASSATNHHVQQQQGGFAAAVQHHHQQQQQLVHQSSFSFSTPSPSAATPVQQQHQERTAAAAALAAIKAEVQQLQLLGDKLAASRAAAAAGSAAAAACDAAAVKHEAAMKQALAAMAALEAAAAAGSSLGSQDMTDYSSIAEEDDEGYDNGTYRASTAAVAAAIHPPGSGHLHRVADHTAAAAAAAAGSSDYEQYYENMNRWGGQADEPAEYSVVDHAGYMQNSAAAAAMHPRHSDPGRMAVAAAAAAAARYPSGSLDQVSMPDQLRQQQHGAEGFGTCGHPQGFAGNNGYNTSGGVSGTSSGMQAKVQQLRALQQMQANLHIMHEELAMLQLLPNMGKGRQQ